MINISNDFKIKTKKIKQQDVKLTINSGELAVKDIHFMPVNVFNKLPIWRLRKKKQVIAREIKYSFEGKLFKTIMKQIEITVKNANEIKDKDINFKYGIFVNNDYEYIDLGDFYIKDIEDSKSKDELTVTGYDKMIRFMKTFKQSELQLVYPCTLLTLILKMCEVCGVELYATNFFYADLVVEEDYFTAQELTYRDVLEKIAQATLTTIFIKDNKLYFCKIGNEVVSKLDKTYLTDLVIKEKFGPVNALVLGRGDVEDNIESKDNESISKNGRIEIRFDENEFVEYKREKVIDSMFKQIKELEYYSFEGADLGVMWFEPCDLIELSDREDNTYKSIYLSANITINTGITSDIGADLIEETNTEYKVTSKEEKKTLKVERLAKKNEGLIQDIIEQNTENLQKISKVEQDVDGITQSVSAVEEKVETVETKADSAKITANTAKTTADSISNNLNNNYYTKTETNSEINQKADSITQSVSKTYATKTETSTAKQEAINSANASTDDKLNNYTVTTELGTFIEQNWECIKYAWNQISEFIQMEILNGNASLAFRKNSDNLLMSLDKLGQHFYNENGEVFAEIGVQTVNDNNYVAFSAATDYDSSTENGMAWGIKTKTDNKFHPILFIKNFNIGPKNSDASCGDLVLNDCNLILDGFGTGIQTGGILISGDPGRTALYFNDINSNKDILTIRPGNILEEASIYILDNISFYKNQAGSNTFRIGNSSNKHVMITDGGEIFVNERAMFGTDGQRVAFDVYPDVYASVHGDLYVSGDVYSNNVSSDKRLKNNIKDSTVNALDIIRKIKHRQFEMKEDNKHYEVGYIAQEMEKIDDNFILKRSQNGKEEERYYINQLPILATATKAIQEQQKEIEQLKSYNKQKDEIIENLTIRIEEIENVLNEKSEVIK